MKTYQKALEYMNKKRNKNTVPDFAYAVKVLHGDGSVLFFENAFVEEKKFDNFEMVLVYTEHCGYHAFFKEDLEECGGLRIYKYK